MYVLHYAPDNASLIIRLALIEADLPYRTALVDRRIRAQDSPAYRALNPTGLIPVLETPEGVISETAAILLWLADRHGAGLAPAAPRGDFLKWLFFLSNTAHADLRQIFYPEQYVGPEGRLGHGQLARARMQRHLRLIDEAARTAPELFAPPSVLGIYTCAFLRWSALYGGDTAWFRLNDTPALQDLARQMDGRASTHALAEAEGLGAAPFSAPQPCTPPEGSAL